MVYMSEEDKATMIGNYKEDFETAGREKVLKELRDNAGLEYEGVKDPNNFISNLSAKVKADALKEASIEPDKKVESLNKDLDILRQQNQEYQNKFTQLENDYQLKESRRKQDSSILGFMPEKTTLPKDDLLTLFNVKYEVETTENGTVIKKGGEVLKDELRNPLSLDKVVSDFSASYIGKPDGGAAKPDDVGNAKAGSYEAFEKRNEQYRYKSRELRLQSKNE